jgi:peptidyl-prolyl cis-trans isomerase D
MLKTIHKYQKSIISFVIMAAVCLAMLGFGMGSYSDRQETYAIKIDDTVISYTDFYRQKKNLEDMYLRQFGDFYYQLKQSQKWNLDQQVIDRTIPSVLLRKLAAAFGLYVGNQELRKLIKQNFPGGYDANTYRTYLAQIGMTAADFEKQLSEDALLVQFRSLITDLSRSSRKEALALIKREKTVYKADYLSILPKDYIKSVKDPSDQELEDYFTDNATDYEIAPRISYDYIVFDPKDHIDQVEVPPEDIEFYYVDHMSDYANPPKVSVSHIQLTFPADPSQEDKDKLKRKAEKIRKKAVGGEDFAALALKHSDDLVTNTVGGKIGWLQSGDKPKAFEEAAYKINGTGIAPLVSTDYGYHIIKVDEYIESKPKELTEVQAEIEMTIRKMEAPGYASVSAMDFHRDWTDSKKSLSEFAKDRKADVKSSGKLLFKEQDVVPDLAGLTAKAFEFPEEKNKLIEYQDKTIVLEIKEYRDIEIPALKDIKGQVLKDYRSVQAQKIAREAADKTIADFKTGTFSSLKQAAEALKTEVKHSEELLRSKSLPGIFSDPEIGKAVFSIYHENQKPDQVFEQGEGFHIVQVVSIKEPDPKELEKELDKYLKQSSGQNAASFIESLVNRLKAEATIDIDSSLLTQEQM